MICGRRKGSEHVEKSVWTIDRAKKLGIAGKDNWQKQPDAMLVARGTAEVCRRIAADVLLGLPYAVEELDSDQVSPDAPKPARRRTAQRTPVEPPSDDLAPSLEPSAGPVEESAEPLPEPTLGDGDE